MREGVAMRAKFLCGAAIVTLATASHATTVIDQENLPSPDWGLNDSLEWQQQVTAGISGLLAGIELFGSSPSDLVRIGLGDAYRRGPFAFSKRVSLNNNGFYINTSQADIMLTAGESFVIDVSGGSPNCCQLEASYSLTRPTYSGGDLYLNYFGRIENYSKSYFHDDMAFVTFMTTPTIPEPAAWTMILLGFAGLGYAGHRRSQQRSARALAG
jgi:hypothetical protein